MFRFDPFFLCLRCCILYSASEVQKRHAHVYLKRTTPVSISRYIPRPTTVTNPTPIARNDNRFPVATRPCKLQMAHANPAIAKQNATINNSSITDATRIAPPSPGVAGTQYRAVAPARKKPITSR